MRYVCYSYTGKLIWFYACDPPVYGLHRIVGYGPSTQPLLKPLLPATTPTIMAHHGNANLPLGQQQAAVPMHSHADKICARHGIAGLLGIFAPYVQHLLNRSLTGSTNLRTNISAAESGVQWTELTNGLNARPGFDISKVIPYTTIFDYPDAASININVAAEKQCGLRSPRSLTTCAHTTRL